MQVTHSFIAAASMSLLLVLDQCESDGGNVAYPPRDSDSVLAESGYSLLGEYRTAVECAQLCESQTVLDVATGSGRMAYTLASAGYSVISGDIDKIALGNTIDKVGHLFPGKMAFTYLDALNLPYQDQSFGSVVSANSLHEIDDPMKALAEMARVVTASGRLLIIDFNANGFEAISRVHAQIHGKEHRRGTADYEAVSQYLQSSFEKVRRFSLSLNEVWVAEGRIATDASSELHSRCFACGRENADGLDLRFVPDAGTSVLCECVIPETYQGYPGIVQGGIVSTVRDSAMTNCLFGLGIEALTARLNVRFRAPVRVGVPLRVSARLVRSEKRVHTLHASIEQSGATKASATARFMPMRQPESSEAQNSV